MRLMTLLLGSTIFFGCIGTRVLEVDPSSETDMRLLVEAAEAQSGEIVGNDKVVRFKRGRLDVTRDTLRAEPRGRRSKAPMSLPLDNGPVEVRFRYRGSPLGAFIGVVAGAGAGYLIGYSTTNATSRSRGFLDFRITKKGAGLIGAVGGGLFGAILGAFMGPKKTTIYRFRPDTPQQMSVVIGVGTRMTQNGESR